MQNDEVERVAAGLDASKLIAVTYDPNYPAFGLIGDPFDHPQHPNQQKGLNVYVRVINFDTGECCLKKLYENKRGLHFKHSGCSPMYLADFTAHATVVKFHVIYHIKENPHAHD